VLAVGYACRNVPPRPTSDRHHVASAWWPVLKILIRGVWRQPTSVQFVVWVDRDAQGHTTVTRRESCSRRRCKVEVAEEVGRAPSAESRWVAPRSARWGGVTTCAVSPVRRATRPFPTAASSHPSPFPPPQIKSLSVVLPPPSLLQVSCSKERKRRRKIKRLSFLFGGGEGTEKCYGNMYLQKCATCGDYITGKEVRATLLFFGGEG
jgi:hypothetical protein